MTKSTKNLYVVYTNFRTDPFHIQAESYDTGYDGGVAFLNGDDAVVAEFLTGVVLVVTL